MIVRRPAGQTPRPNFKRNRDRLRVIRIINEHRTEFETNKYYMKSREVK